jgi:predicted RNase H-like HicB family nuclease
MKSEYTAVVKQEDDWWIGWIEEVPGVNCQERTYDELRETLEVTVKEALEFNRQDALAAAGIGFKEEKIAISRERSSCNTFAVKDVEY